jgi:NADH-quinone oxidoreductase subunit B
MAIDNDFGEFKQFIPDHSFQGRRPEKDFRLGEGYQAGKGNSPAESVFNRVLPNALTAKSDELFSLARKSSLWTLSFGLACCAIEMISTHMSHHDLDRFGVVTWPSPRQADVMIVAGTVVKKMADPIKLLYEQMPDPKWVIAMGSCATNGGPYYKSYSVVMGVDHLIPVDVYIPGCPPRPEALMYGVLQLQEKIQLDSRNRRSPLEDSIEIDELKDDSDSYGV